MWFGLAVIALAGAVALLYVDRSRRDQLGRVRQMWAKAQGYTYAPTDDQLISHFHRAALAKLDDAIALDVVRGVRRGEKFVLFDVEETSTIVAVKRPVGSDVDIDLRLKSTPPPREKDMQLLGAIGPRVVFATDIEIARRVCDQRMAAFTESVPAHVSLLWSESEWALGSVPLSSTGRDWDAAIDAVARLSGLLHVLPPVRNRQAAPRPDVPRRRPDIDAGGHAPNRPQAPAPAPTPAARQAPRPPVSAPVDPPRRPSGPTPINRDAERRRRES
ncbi:hypothetical protein E5720_12865 [Rhodococcus sp. PAMC28707]|uniref:hypothetical protein n=1 Tax=unclassified Rhodococcus (in: high G+C Gram-positive bacteria) TaxID=192944 RepID=UPI00109E0B4A|nr:MULTISPECIES: hypothetical protein [unclassified Rhodococcus (in: high G+C Gram-positive bacteria)]QCB52425.1 hypothetical protein E5769_01150 [Rhodococcus sp. PAMC28705]QCB61023.1 hypothetical protein E5720_12865 [Rhodococcus sp. PAMC28707]